MTSLGPVNDFWMFDIKSGKWMPISTINTPPPSSRFGFTNFDDGVHEYFVVFGGAKATGVGNHLFMYVIFSLNMTSLVWDDVQYLGDIPPMMEEAQIRYYNNYLYLAAGKATSSLNQFPQEFFRYSLVENKWKDISNPTNSYISRTYTGSCIVDEFFYLIYGWSDATSQSVPDIMRVNLTTSDYAWEPFHPTNSAIRDSYAIATVGSEVYLFGGLSREDSNYLNDLLSLSIPSINFTTITENGLYPSARLGASLHLIDGSFYLFGGQGLSTLYSDLWLYRLDSASWSLLSQFGSIPSARTQHGAATQGDGLVIWGGQGEEELLSDLFLLNSLTSSWTQLVPSSVVAPNGARGACVVMDMPYLYIFGGISELGCLGELWIYDTGTNKYTLQDSSGPQLAYAYCQVIGNNFHVMSGQDLAGGASYSIYLYSFSLRSWSVSTYPTPGEGGSQGLNLFFAGKLISISGQAWNINARTAVFVTNSSQTVASGKIPECLYLSAYVYYGFSLYSFGGGSIIGHSLRQSVPTNLFVQIDLRDICANGVCEALCSPGTTQGTSCTVALPGYYSEGFGNTLLQACPAGTYNSLKGATSNRQCYPCPDGSFAPSSGYSACLTCPSSSICPIGSSVPIDPGFQSLYQSAQPDIYRIQDISSIVMQYEIAIGIFILLVILISLCSKEIARRVHVIDIYPTLHNHANREPMILYQTYLGGQFSLLFIGAAIILIGIAVITYQLNNITEVKALVPLVTLESEVSAFVSSDVHIYTSFLRYGGSCLVNNQCNPLIIVNLQNIQYSSETISCSFIGKTCMVTVVLQNCVFGEGSQLSIVLEEELSYATGISVNVSSDSSIPGLKSSILDDLYPRPGYMFIGSSPSEFYFVMIPSLFESQSSEWPAKSTGYHVSAGSAPLAGSEYVTSDLAITSQLQVNVFLVKSTNGLFTSRILNQTLLFVASGMLGAVFGVMGAVGGVMKFTEKQVKRYSAIRGKEKKYSDVKRRQKKIRECITDAEMHSDSEGIMHKIRTTLATRHS